jgi:KDO2-lipid IV(A) lauroyltransferase
METLGVAFPSMGEGERRARALEAYEHLFMLGLEMAFTPRVITPDTWAEHVQLGDLSGAARLLVAGRPCVMITGHCGNWELLGYALALLGFPMHALYRPLDLAPMDAWVRRTRERRGLRLVDKFGATEAIPSIMRRGEPVAFIADQNAGDRGLFVPFFGRMASTYKAVGLTAIQHGAPIVCGQARRLVASRDARSAAVEDAGATVGFAGYDGTGPLRYRIDVVDIIRPEDWEGRPDPLFYVTARYRRALEGMVRRAPEQNLWLHRYWKSRPRWEHQGKGLPGAVRAKLWTLPWMTEGEMARIEEWTGRDGAALAGR